MLFPTPTFGLFLVCVLIASWVVRRSERARRLVLLGASWVFYICWDPRFLALILFSTALDYWVGKQIARHRDRGTRKALLGLSLAGNLGVLAFFKYYNFFIDNLDLLTSAVGLPLPFPVLDIVLPVGISFYTFQTLSYTIDVYRDELPAVESFVDFALFVAFFPQLVAGPIVRAKEFLPQLERPLSTSDERIGSGLYLLLKGLFKKAVIADLMAIFLVDRIFADPKGYGAIGLLLAVYGFKHQLYCDFSGYSDMAIGCGRLFGFELPQNFRSPYKATSIRDYWTRWHISLGTWFRDYVFFPMGGSRGSLARTNLNLFVLMLLVGLWHGASWRFIVWGAFYGVMICLERTWDHWRGRSKEKPPVGWRRGVRIFFTFHLTTAAAFLFRVPDLRTLRVLWEGRSTPASGLVQLPWVVWWLFGLALVLHLAPEAWKQAAELRFSTLPAAGQALAVVSALLVVQLAGSHVNPFYYFQF